MTEEEENENTAIKVTVEVKNCGECVMHHWKNAGENVPKVFSYLSCYSKAGINLKRRSCCSRWLTSLVHKHRQEKCWSDTITIITVFVQKMQLWFSTLNFVQAAIVASTNQELTAHTAATLGANTVNLPLQMHQPHRMSKHITNTGAPRGISHCSCYKEFVCS